MQLGPRIRTVVNKTDATGGPFRVFPMEVLAGEPNLETKVVENGNTFQLEYGKVVHFTLPPPTSALPKQTHLSHVQRAAARTRPAAIDAQGFTSFRARPPVPMDLRSETRRNQRVSRRVGSV